MDRRVAIDFCNKYDSNQIYSIIINQFNELGLDKDYFYHKKVLIKPNLLAKRDPSKAVTTHPAVVNAVCTIMKEYEAVVTIAESPAGIYTPGSLKESYKQSGFLETAQALGANFNYDTSIVKLSTDRELKNRVFEVIRPVIEADIVLDLCKLKSHSLTKMTCAVKNLFGLIPGMDKVEVHARFSKQEDFLDYLIDLCEAVCEKKPIIAVCDAILAMEGEGPGTGHPRFVNAVLSSRSPYALDLAACEMIGFRNTVEMIEREKKRGLIPDRASDLEIIGTKIAELKVHDFIAPKSHRLFHLFGLIPDFLKPHPVIDRELCIGCGTCARSCPASAIIINNKKAQISKKKCIRCFCCQELCPYAAVETKRHFIFKMFKR